MSYTHFTLIERGKLEGFLAVKMSIREIARIMGRHHSTIARKIKRNNDNFYHAATAHQNASDRKAKASSRRKLSVELIAIIEDKLFSTWFPKQIVCTVLYKKVSFKSIYCWIYEEKIKSNNIAVLRHKGKKRKGVEKRGIFSNGVSISERSEEANNRSEFV